MLKAKFHHAHLSQPVRLWPSAQEAFDHIMDIYQKAMDEGHARLYKDNELPQLSGATVCHLVDDKDVRLATGYSFCSAKDQFCKRTGRLIAEGRARKRLEEMAWAFEPAR